MRLFVFLALIFALALGNVQAATEAVEITTANRSSVVQFGISDLTKAVAESKISNIRIVVTVSAKGDAAKVLSAQKANIPEKPESFVIARSGKTVVVAGSDEVGAMYGCFELAERINMDGKAALDIKSPIIQSPFVEFRAINPFLNLPYGHEDIDNWWFLSDDFWKGYIDMLARARINWIDMHGMYDIKATSFPNIYPYFIKSDKFPEVGIEPEKADRNLAMLNKVIKMAKDRGIKFAIMSYSTSWNGPWLRKSPYEQTEDNLADYTREVVAKMIRQCPDLAMIGFRIGESGRGEDFYMKSYIPAIQEANRKIDLYTRSWFAAKPKVLEIGRSFPGRLFLEIKYNGEQYGPPHMIAGGKMAVRDDYSYRSYFSYPQAYKVIWQIRLNGTHRVFPWGQPEFVARSAENSHLGGAIGFCTEPINCYYPAYEYLHKEGSECAWYKWVYQRDWFFYNVWGRMSYDPKVPERVWLRKFKDRFGAKTGEALYRSFTTASQIIPYAKMMYSIGPDHRQHAPELETGGGVHNWADNGPYDLANIQSANEYATRLINNDPCASLTPFQSAELLQNLSAESMRYLEQAKKSGTTNKEAICLFKDIESLSCLGNFYADRLRAAATFSIYRLTGYPAFADATRSYVDKASKSWGRLATIGEEHFHPFVDSLRMHTENFTWRKEGENLPHALDRMNEIKPSTEEPRFGLEILEPKGDGKGPSVDVKSELSSIVNGSKTLTVRAKVADPSGVGAVYLRVKPLPSESRWRRLPMSLEGGYYQTTAEVSPHGLQWCVEALDKDGNGTLWPDFRHDIPYKIINSWEDKSLLTGSVSDVLNKLLNNESERNKYSAMFVGSSSTVFSYLSPEIKAKTLEVVEKGLPLIIDCQNFSKFDLSWLPGNLTTAGFNGNDAFLDLTHPLFKGMPETVNGNRIVNMAFERGDKDWKFVTSPKTVAIREYGDGMIICNQLRLSRILGEAPVQFVENLMDFISDGNKHKPLLVLDEGGSEGSSRNATLPLLLGLNDSYVLCDN